MQTTAIIDPGNGRVYRAQYPSIAAARAIIRGPYCRNCRIVLKSARGVEIYERGAGSLAQRRVTA